MNNYYLKLSIIFCLATNACANTYAALPDMNTADFGFIDDTPNIASDSLKKIKDFSLGNKTSGLDRALTSIDNVSKSADNLVKNGITIHWGPQQAIPQIGFCVVGILASACGLGVITHTALQKKAENAKQKYLIGAGMTALGMASLIASNQIWLKNKS